MINKNKMVVHALLDGRRDIQDLGQSKSVGDGFLAIFRIQQHLLTGAKISS